MLMSFENYPKYHLSPEEDSPWFSPGTTSAKRSSLSLHNVARASREDRLSALPTKEHDASRCQKPLAWTSPGRWGRSLLGGVDPSFLRKKHGG